MFKSDAEWPWQVGTENPFDSLLGFAPSDFIQLNAAKLAAPSNTTATPPQMQSDGTGLPSLMAYFKLYDETKYDLIVALFRNVIRQIERVRIDRVPIGGGTLGEGLGLAPK